jgi:hypothetical protein
MPPSSPGSVDPPDLSDLGVEEVDEPARSRWGPARFAVIATCALILVMWILVYVLAAVHKPVDRLDSRAFAKQAEPICKVTADQLAALPKAWQSSGNVARAEVVTESNQDLREMLDKLATVAPTTGSDGRIITEWLHDYGTYVGNRENYATRLRTDPSARFYEAQKEPGEQITDPVDSLATANDMDDCVAPEDLS